MDSAVEWIEDVSDIDFPAIAMDEYFICRAVYQQVVQMGLEI